MKRIILFVFLASVLMSSSSCRDRMSMSVINNSSSEVQICSPELSLDVIIKQGEIKTVEVSELNPSFTVTVTQNLIKKRYSFHDVDHWFSLTHEVKVIIDKDYKISISGSRGERFFPEEPDR